MGEQTVPDPEDPCDLVCHPEWGACCHRRTPLPEAPPPKTEDRLTQIVREHYADGRWRGHHLATSRGSYNLLKVRHGRATSTWTWQNPPDAMWRLLGIDVVVDDSLPPDTWQLRDTRTGQVVEVINSPNPSPATPERDVDQPTDR